MSRRSIRFLAVLATVGLIAVFAFVAYPYYWRSQSWNEIRTALDNRELKSGLELLERHLEYASDDLDARLAAAQTARRLDDFATADRHLKRFEADGGPRDVVILEKTLRQSQIGAIDGRAALRFCKEYPENPIVPFMLEAVTRGFLATVQPSRAEEAVSLWLDRKPTGAERSYALFLKGLACERQGKVPAAIESYRESISLKSDAHESWFALGQILTRESPGEAKTLFEKLQQTDYRPFEVKLGLARSLRQLGELDRAVELLEELNRLQPDSVAVMVELARVELDRGRLEYAESMLKNILGRVPNDRDALVQWSRCLRSLGRDAESQAVLEQLRKLDEELFRQQPTGSEKP